MINHRPNYRAALDAAGAVCLRSLRCGRGASERKRSAKVGRKAQIYERAQ